MNQVRKIKLFGGLAKLCGTNEVELAGESPRIIVAGLVSAFGSKVKKYFLENNFHVVLESKDIERYISEDEVDFQIGGTESVSFIPVIEGAGKAGKIIVGVILIVAGVLVTGLTWGSAASVGGGLVAAGVGLIVGGIMDMLNSPKNRESPDERASFIFNGAVNATEQGQPVPIVYGRFKTGSVVLSGGLDVEELSTYTSPVGYNPAPGSVWDMLQTP